jgi:putative protease
VAAILPRVIHENEKKQVEELLQHARQMGVKDALVGNIGHIQFVRSLGFQARAAISG